MKQIRFGLVTDAHYSDEESEKNRFFRESIEKMSAFINQMNMENVDFIIITGDITEQQNTEDETKGLGDLNKIESIFQRYNGPVYHVVGNHDLDAISKEQYQQIVSNTNIPEKSTFYSFDTGDIHCVVLDANFNSLGTDHGLSNAHWTEAHIPEFELQWLKSDLESTNLPVIVFIHQQLNSKDDHCVNNAETVRDVLESGQNVLAVFQGHNHDGGYNCFEGIHYYTLKAMVEGTGELNNSYAVVSIDEDMNVDVHGFYNAESRYLMKS